MNVVVPESLQRCLAELILAGGCVLLPLLSYVPVLRRRAGDLALLVVAASAVGAVMSMDALQGFLAGRMVVVDPFAAFFQFVLSMVALGVVWMSTRSSEGDVTAGGWSWGLFVASLLGMHLMVASVHVVTTWAGFEVAGVSCALWIASRREPAGSVDSFLFVLLEGAAASAMMLMGLALLFGLTGALDYATIGARLSLALAAPGGRAVMFAALVLVFGGMGFGAAMVPWHFSRADVAESAPLPVAAWLATGSTIAVLATLARFVRIVLCQPSLEGGWTALPGIGWPALLSVIAMVTMTVGNVAALRQANVGRLIAWLSVAQTGYLLMALVALRDSGLQAMLFHSVAYALMMMGVPATLSLVTGEGGSADIAVLRGLARRSAGARAAAVAMALFLFSLAGVLPLAGYVGRVYVLTAVFEAGRSALALVAALNSLLGLLCCIRVVAIMLERPRDAAARLPVDFEAALLVALLAAGTVGLGLWPAALATLAERSVVFFGG